MDFVNDDLGISGMSIEMTSDGNKTCCFDSTWSDKRTMMMMMMMMNNVPVLQKAR
jgi:hypothetical protein